MPDKDYRFVLQYMQHSEEDSKENPGTDHENIRPSQGQIQSRESGGTQKETGGIDDGQDLSGAETKSQELMMQVVTVGIHYRALVTHPAPDCGKDIHDWYHQDGDGSHDAKLVCMLAPCSRGRTASMKPMK